MGYSFRLAARVLIYASSHRQHNAYHGLFYTSREALAGMRNSWRKEERKEGRIGSVHMVNTSRTHDNFILSAQERDVAPWWERSLMVRWVVRSNLHFSFQPVLHDWHNKGHGMCYPVCGMVHIKEPLLLIGKSSPCGSSGYPLSLSEWFFTINHMCDVI